MYFRQPEEFAVSLFKEQVMRRLQAAGVPFETFLERKRNHFDYARHMVALEQAFGRVEPRSYEAERRRGLVRGFFDLIGAQSVSEPDGPAQVRTSVSNRAILWLQKHLEDTVAKYRSRVLFALRQSDTGLLADPPGTTLWPSHESFASFARRHAASYELPFVKTPSAQETRFAEWDDDRQAAVDEAFERWQLAHGELLQHREKLGLAFYDPDPPGA